MHEPPVAGELLVLQSRVARVHPGRVISLELEVRRAGGRGEFDPQGAAETRNTRDPDHQGALDPVEALVGSGSSKSRFEHRAFDRRGKLRPYPGHRLRACFVKGDSIEPKRFPPFNLIETNMCFSPRHGFLVNSY